MKLRISLGCALVAGLLTINFGLINDIRLLALFQRILMSMVFFGSVGFLAVTIAERYFERIDTATKTKGQSVDIITQEEPVQVETNSFEPLSPDNFERIQRVK